MRPLLYFLLLLIPVSAICQNRSPITVFSHNRKTITTDPSKGVNNYPSWAIFPSKETPARRIKMLVTLGCPDSLPCAHWDYLDHIMLVRQGGKKGETLNYELGRMLTPYGSIYSQGWDFTWWVDVTDFSMLLRDSVLINYAHSGYEPVSVGWSLTVRFEISEGPPIAEPQNIVPLWNGSFRYGDPSLNIGEKLTPFGFTVTGKGFTRFRIQHTGHGMDRPKGCSEFCSRWREVLLDQAVIDRKDLWKDCGSNPLYPQGGTWIYDRALWCPGDLQQPDIYDLFAAPGNHSLAIRMEPYTATANIQANEDIASYLIQYKKPAESNDVSIEEIIVPNNHKAFNRYNPAIENPRIVIRNNGRNALKSLKIIWFSEGFPKHSFLWKGDLPFNKSTGIVLPGKIEYKSGINNFTAIASEPNGKPDGWEEDNILTSRFNAPPLLPEMMILQYLTNNNPEENSICISNLKGDTLFSRKPGGTKPATFYTDTLDLKEGDYALSLADTAGNGLEFWYEARQGYGYLRLLDMNGRLLHNFESDCGNGQFLAFRTSPDYVADTTVTQYAFVLFPRRVKDTISLDHHSDKRGSMEIVITSDGVPVETHWYKNIRQGKLTFRVDHLPPGRYIMDVLTDGVSRFKRRFNKE